MPEFFPETLAQTILDVGKTVDFLRRVCHVQDPFMDSLARAQPLANLPLTKGTCRDVQLGFGRSLLFLPLRYRPVPGIISFITRSIGFDPTRTTALAETVHDAFRTASKA